MRSVGGTYVHFSQLSAGGVHTISGGNTQQPTKILQNFLRIFISSPTHVQSASNKTRYCMKLKFKDTIRKCSPRSLSLENSLNSASYIQQHIFFRGQRVVDHVHIFLMRSLTSAKFMYFYLTTVLPHYDTFVKKNRLRHCNYPNSCTTSHRRALAIEPHCWWQLMPWLCIPSQILRHYNNCSFQEVLI